MSPALESPLSPCGGGGGVLGRRRGMRGSFKGRSERLNLSKETFIKKKIIIIKESDTSPRIHQVRSGYWIPLTPPTSSKHTSFFEPLCEGEKLLLVDRRRGPSTNQVAAAVESLKPPVVRRVSGGLPPGGGAVLGLTHLPTPPRLTKTNHRRLWTVCHSFSPSSPRHEAGLSCWV